MVRERPRQLIQISASPDRLPVHIAARVVLAMALGAWALAFLVWWSASS